MQTQEANILIQKQLDNLSSALEAGKSENLTAFLHTMARFHHYSLGNVLLIMFQNPDATRVAGFNTWKSLGRYVKQGEKGIAILAPMLLKNHAAEEDAGGMNKEAAPSPTASPQQERDDKYLSFRVVHVFDVSQTEGKDLPEFASVRGDPGDYAERLKSLVRQLSIELEYGQDLGGADGVSKNGTIVLRQGLAPAAEFSVLVHELAHELLHQGDNRNGKTRTVRETEAEAVAFVVAQAIGLDAGTAAADYIQLYRGDKVLLNQSLEDIRKTSGQILTALLGKERAS